MLIIDYSNTLGTKIINYINTKVNWRAIADSEQVTGSYFHLTGVFLASKKFYLWTFVAAIKCFHVLRHCIDYMFGFVLHIFTEYALSS